MAQPGAAGHGDSPESSRRRLWARVPALRVQVVSHASGSHMHCMQVEAGQGTIGHGFGLSSGRIRTS